MGTYTVDFNKVKEEVDVRVLLAHFGLVDGLEQRGDELVGMCPLGEESHGKADSFSFNTNKKAFQCFACKRRGSVIDFVKFYHGIGIKEAAREIAQIMAGGKKAQKAAVDAETLQAPQEAEREQKPSSYMPAPEIDHQTVTGKVADSAVAVVAPLSEQELAMIALVKEILAVRLVRGECFTQPEAARRFLMVSLSFHEREVFGCIFLDNRNRMIAFEELFFGSISGATVSPREVVRRALQLNAAAIICGHNHPSGDPEPSPADCAITQRIKEACAVLDIRLLDHIVIGGTETVSLAERGEL